eukprot:768334-Hanusia_phi.AAC.2
MLSSPTSCCRPCSCVPNTPDEAATTKLRRQECRGLNPDTIKEPWLEVGQLSFEGRSTCLSGLTSSVQAVRVSSSVGRGEANPGGTASHKLRRQVKVHQGHDGAREEREEEDKEKQEKEEEQREEEGGGGGWRV